MMLMRRRVFGMRAAQLLLLLLCIGQLQGAAIICGSNGNPSGAAKASSTGDVDGESTTVASATKPSSEVNQFLHNVQCTLEKAKPWIEDLEKEAKRLEETAKRVGLSIINRFGDLMDTLLGAANKRPTLSANGTSTSTSTSSSSSPNPSEDKSDCGTSTEAHVEQMMVTAQSPPPLPPLISLDDANDSDNEISIVEPAEAETRLK
ncbi:putative uncharacterized protein DDB_G0281733 [Scaptodrosophila lebanonensis]|uniref:Uncharacterized protein n=1 Tax=Drosophila lebanonensis TaxID=7225 RepID=A0A6J2TT13_DROLE|nr:putative uncharacterized protein DDB_G0281733 [Scaptodrosophila lebanonensis]